MNIRIPPVKKLLLWLLPFVAGLFVVLLIQSALIPRPEEPPEALSAMFGIAEDGAYLARIAGCIACHTDSDNSGQLLGGGAAIETPFGTFFAPNITSDPVFGIGGWSLAEFYQALTSGVSPAGEHYYPSFPYPSYAYLSTGDIADIKAYLDTVRPVQQLSKPHELSWPFSFRPLLGLWKVIFTSQSGVNVGIETMERGEYLVRGPGHCTECHSQRNLLGAVDDERYLQGNTRGPEGHAVPALTASNSDMQGWDKTDLVFYLQSGLRPDGDVAGSSMAEVVDEVTSHLNQSDAEAIADYLLKLR